MKISNIKGAFKNAQELYCFWSKSRRHSRDLVCKQDNIKVISPKDKLVFCTLRNEAHRITYFLDYYRKLGINHFIFVDNGSDDDFLELVTDCGDVTVYYTQTSYKASNFGMHWLNYLLRKHGSGHWCLTCDPDEFLVFPKIGSLGIVDLTNYLDQTYRPSFFTIMIDMYGQGKLKDSNYVPGTNPLVVNPYFDKSGYFYNQNCDYNSVWIQGGVRMRTLFKTTPYDSPTLNKVPLIKWKWYYSYISSMHMVIPRRLNGGFKTNLTGALLHFKFISSFEDKIIEEMERGEHYDDSIEYKKYMKFLADSENYHPESSVAYRGWEQLSRLGLIKDKEWI